MAASSSTNDAAKKVLNPSMTSPFIEPCYKCAYDKLSRSGVMFHERSLQSLQMSTQQLKKKTANIPSKDEGFQVDKSFDQNGFNTPLGYVMIAGDGVISICFSLCPDLYNDRHDIVTYDHITEKVAILGYLPLNGYYDKFGYPEGLLGCFTHEPSVLCQLSPNGDFVVVFGPREYGRTNLFPENAPIIFIYHVYSAKLLLQVNCAKFPFLKCDAIGISVAAVNVEKGEYRIALVTRSMEIRLWNTITKQETSLQLEGISSFRDSRYNDESCAKFSPDGRCLSVLCSTENENKSTCLVLNGNTLEPLCWMAFNELNTWLRWLFPIFSICGTKVVLSTYWNSDNKYDLTKYEIIFHQVPFLEDSLKYLCRTVILQHVHPSSLGQLPLSSNLIAYLTSGSTQYGSLESVVSTKTKLRCKCTLV